MTLTNTELTDKTSTDKTRPFGNSHVITTNQTGVHDKLAEVVERHLTKPFLKPVSAHTQAAFDQINQVVQNFAGEIILDACCGVGLSTRNLARANPNALVIGVDKSFDRITRQIDEHLEESFDDVDNYQLVRADLNDFFRLVVQAKWPVSQHYILYPNPWPKSKHLQRRWHGSAVFPDILNIGQTLVLRSNWRLYLEEFASACAIKALNSELIELPLQEKPLTPFEKKYQGSGQTCYQLTVKLKNSVNL